MIQLVLSHLSLNNKQIGSKNLFWDYKDGFELTVLLRHIVYNWTKQGVIQDNGSWPWGAGLNLSKQQYKYFYQCLQLTARFTVH